MKFSPNKYSRFSHFYFYKQHYHKNERVNLFSLGENLVTHHLSGKSLVHFGCTMQKKKVHGQVLHTLVHSTHKHAHLKSQALCICPNATQSRVPSMSMARTHGARTHQLNTVHFKCTVMPCTSTAQLYAQCAVGARKAHGVPP